MESFTYRTEARNLVPGDDVLLDGQFRRVAEMPRVCMNYLEIVLRSSSAFGKWHMRYRPTTVVTCARKV